MHELNIADNPLQPEPLLQFFDFKHLPERLQAVSKPFCGLATEIAYSVPKNDERTMALRALGYAKDCAVRAVLMAEGV